MEGVPLSKHFFSVEREYERCISALTRTGILKILPISKRNGVTGTDGKEYPTPTTEQVAELFAYNKELSEIKIQQGFNRLELIPMAMPVSQLTDLLKAALMKHAAEEKIYRTRHSHADPFINVSVNTEKQVWLWETLKQTLETEEIVYFPREFSGNHGGLTKSEVLFNRQICAFPGWSVGLTESFRILPQKGAGKTLGGRKQLETGSSPREYLKILQGQAYHGETGRTTEDFITAFLTCLEETGEISNDRHDNNSLWLPGQYIKYNEHLKSDLIPTGWWHRNFGRVRLDAHRPGNKICTRSWGVATIVRLPGF